MPRISWKGSALLAPLPAVMVTCEHDGHANVFTAAWCGIVSTHPPRVYVSIRPTRHSYALIRDSREFVLNLTPAALAKTCDYVGTVTGRCVDKFAKTGLTLIPSSVVNCPTLEQSPLALECRVTDVIPLGSHDMFLADIVAVDVDEELIGQDGKLRLDRASLVAYAHGDYYALGKKLGKFGYSVAKKNKNRPQSKKQTAPRTPKKGS
jgi:flavin reductase (DIM6/NTAB) family NADH-FMN oxidoreductase RutF